MSKITNDSLNLSAWHRMLYSCTHMATVRVKWIIQQTGRPLACKRADHGGCGTLDSGWVPAGEPVRYVCVCALLEGTEELYGGAWDPLTGNLTTFHSAGHFPTAFSLSALTFRRVFGCRLKWVFTRDSICYSAYMLSPVRLSVRHTGGSYKNGWSWTDYEIFTIR